MFLHSLLFFSLSSIVASTDITDGDKKLLLVQAVWRHGDRAPTTTYANDKLQEDAWTFGGSGWGQLSPRGMAQHLHLGQLIRQRYVDTGFLSPYYNSKEIYVRSTDVNRTVISAISNMIGMYGQADYNVNRNGTDYPLVAGWPLNFVPIPVHTVDYDTDYIGNADADCARQDKLWAMAQTSDEVLQFMAQNNTRYVFEVLNTNCGTEITLDNLWWITDAFLIENMYYPGQQPSWYSPSFDVMTNEVNDQGYLYKNGVYQKPVIMNNLDIGLEIKKLRGGSLTNDIMMHMNLKLNNKVTNKRKFMDNLKYYVYSAHDETVYAFFSCLGIQSLAVKPHGYPLYSAAAFIELWQDTKTSQNYFKLLYHANENSTFEVITKEIDGCNDDYCDLNVFSNIAKKVQPDQPMPSWCLVDPTITNNTNTKTTTPSHVESTTKTSNWNNNFHLSLVFVAVSCLKYGY